MARYFISRDDIFDRYIFIRGDDVKHIKNVLRMKVGEQLHVSDCTGMDYTAELIEISVDLIKAVIVDMKPNKTEPHVDVVLYQGLPKSDKMELIIQKCVELGVKAIVPVVTEHAVVRIDEDKDVRKKVDRWQKIATEAAKQSQRGIIPVVAKPVKYNEAVLAAAKADLAIIPYENEKTATIKSFVKNKGNIKSIAYLIGPEGGFSEKEIAMAVDNGIKPVTLGPRILRTETAGLAVLSILMYEFDEDSQYSK